MPEPAFIFIAIATALAASTTLVVAIVRSRCRRLVAEAAAGERRRLARDLHDGLAQELAFISVQARQLAQRGEDETLDQVTDAAERALGEARELVSTLRAPGDEWLGTAIAETAERLAERHGARLRLEVNPEISVHPKTGRQLLRILTEALSNSLVHGRARAVTVELLGGEGVRLRVTDDGTGFEPRAHRGSHHFGLTGMRERAREIGADLFLRSHPGAGTEVEVVLP